MFTHHRQTIRHRHSGLPFRPRVEGLEDRLAPAVIHEFPLPSGMPSGITTGPDGNVWFTAQQHYTPSQIARITPTGEMSFYPVARGFFMETPSAITAGPDGNLWSTLTGTGYKFQPYYSWFERTTTTGTITEFPSSTVIWGNSLTAGPDGNVWFTTQGTVGKVTQSGTVTLYPTSASDIGAITTGPDGNLWFTEYSAYKVPHADPDGTIVMFDVNSADKIGRMTPDGTLTEFALPKLDDRAYATGITAGPDGNVWFTRYNYVGFPFQDPAAQVVDQIGRITPTGTVTFFAVPTSGSQPNGITVGADGALWFTETASNQLGRITTEGVISEVALPTTNGRPEAITTGGDGNLWFTLESGAIGQLVLAAGLTPDQVCVSQLYRDLLGREADPTGLASWTRLLDQGQSRAQVIQGIQNSAEYRTNLVTQLYVQLLQRAPDPGGLQSDLGFLAQGGTDQALKAVLIGSDEYFARHGGTNSGFLHGVYQEVLGRAAAATEIQPWLNSLGAGGTRTTVALGIMSSAEGATVATQTMYLDYLQRAADPGGLTYFVTALQQGASYQQVSAAMLASSEWFATVMADTNQAWVTQVYAAELQRPPDAAGLAYWTGLLNSGSATPYQVGLQIALSAEAAARFAQQQFLHYLGRDATPAELQFSVQLLNSGGTREQLTTVLTSSLEYYARAGGTALGFLNALYADALGRPIDPNGQASFSQALANGATRAQVADMVFTSAEYQDNLVQNDYLTLLGRAADPTGLANWTNHLRQGARDEQVIAALLGSDEYFSRWT